MTIIDTSKLSAPVKAIFVDGNLVELPAGGTWAGIWAFPPVWTEAQQEQFTAVKGNLFAEQKRLEMATAALAAHLESPETMIATAVADVDEAQRAREAQERLTAGVKIWQKARETYGDNVRHLPTVDGDIVIMVGMTLMEADGANARAKNLADKVLESDPSAFQRAKIEHTNAHRDAMRAKIVWPPRERLDELTQKRPALWGDIGELRNDMARGRADAEGKGSAP